MTRIHRALVRLLLIGAVGLVSAAAYADPSTLTPTAVGNAAGKDGNTSAGSVGCNSANVFGAKLFTDICWKRAFPLKIMGVGSVPDAPVGSTDAALCSCKDKLGVPKPGTTFSDWLPYRLTEVVRNPYCSPVLGGKFLTRKSTRFAGSHPPREHDTFAGYWHSHSLSFPIVQLLNLITSTNCNAGGYSDIDFVMLSELDPTVSDPELSVMVYAETVLFANPIALMGCAGECAVVTAKNRPPPGETFWCQGCWGSLYPLTNTASTAVSKSQSNITIASKQLALKHRRGMAQKTYGPTGLCGGSIYPMLPKEQYQWSQFFPYPEATGNCTHWTGENTTKGNMDWRGIPTVGEDRVFLLWRYVECCITP